MNTPHDRPLGRPRSRNWLRFSLRTGLVGITLACIWLAHETNRARRQAGAVRKIQELGGVVIFDYQCDEQGSPIPNKEPSAPLWLRNLLGDEYFRRVQFVDLGYTNGHRLENAHPVTDADLELLAALPDITLLDLRNNAITDAGLKHLTHLKKLRSLYLGRTHIEGPGLRYISQLPRLEYLSLAATPVDPKALLQLKGLPSLTFLDLSLTDVGDADLAILEDLNLPRRADPNRPEYDLSDTNVTGDGAVSTELHFRLGDRRFRNVGFMHEFTFWPNDYRPTQDEVITAAKHIGCKLTIDEDNSKRPIVSLESQGGGGVTEETLLQVVRQLTDLQTIYINNAGVGDRFLEGLPELPNLHCLKLEYCPRITDKGVVHLAKHRSLAEVSLCGTRVADRGLVPLKSLRRLKRVSLGIRVTPLGVHQLQQALPGCEVSVCDHLSSISDVAGNLFPQYLPPPKSGPSP